jgi:antitoxin ParD1/3/4
VEEDSLTATQTLTLSPELAALIREKVESGRYGDANAVVEEALRLLDERDRLEWLRAEVAKGFEELDRGEGVLYTPELMERLKREAEEAVRLGRPIDDAVTP